MLGEVLIHIANRDAGRTNHIFRNTRQRQTTLRESAILLALLNNLRVDKHLLEILTLRIVLCQFGAIYDKEAYRLAYLDQIGDEEEARDLGANFRISMDGGVTFGEIYKSPVTSPHGPAELADGSILWVGRTFSRNDALMSQDCVCAYRVDPENGGMEYLGRIDNVVIDGERMLSCEPHAIELEDGSILCHIRVQSAVSSKLHFTIYQSISQDGGRSWSEPKPLLPKLGGSPAHIIRHSSGALISVYGYREFPYGIKVMFSLDNGKTWDTNHDLYVNGVSSDLGYPSTAELSDGSLLTVFYAHPEQGEPAVIMQQKWRMENEI
jgi:hypothetical protein